jgi:hypothetical protein
MESRLQAESFAFAAFRLKANGIKLSLKAGGRIWSAATSDTTGEFNSKGFIGLANGK